MLSAIKSCFTDFRPRRAQYCASDGSRLLIDLTHLMSANLKSARILSFFTVRLKRWRRYMLKRWRMRSVCDPPWRQCLPSRSMYILSSGVFPDAPLKEALKLCAMSRSASMTSGVFRS